MFFQVSTSLFSTSKLPQTVDVETATKGVQLDADQLQSLKQSFVNANKPNTATPSIDSSSNQDDLDSGIISSKPGAGLLWDKPYLSSLKESFEVHIYLVAYIFRLGYFAFLGRRYSESLFRKPPDSN